MANFTIEKLPADQGMRLVLDMIKKKYIAEQMEGGNSSCQTLLGIGISHALYNGKPYYYSSRMVANIQKAVTEVGAMLMQVQIIQGPQDVQEYPLCYGEDMVSKFKVLGKVIKLPYLFVNVLGKTERWQKMHLADKKEVRYYNQFTDDELSMINDGIRSIALKLCSIQLQYQDPCAESAHTSISDSSDSEPSLAVNDTSADSELSLAVNDTSADSEPSLLDDEIAAGIYG